MTLRMVLPRRALAPLRRRSISRYLQSNFSTIEKCPSPKCACASTPTGLDIDHSRDLNGTMAAYTQHIVVFTGQRDWTSRIEDDGAGTGWGELVRKLKEKLGRGGEFANVCYARRT